MRLAVFVVVGFLSDPLDRFTAGVEGEPGVSSRDRVTLPEPLLVLLSTFALPEQFSCVIDLLPCGVA